MSLRATLPAMTGEPVHSPGREAFPALRRLLAHAAVALGGLSLLCSLGALAVPIFNMEMFNHVLPTRNLHTLGALGVGLIICLLGYGSLAFLRERALAVLAERLVARLSVPLLETTAGAAAPAGLQALRDLETLRAFIAAPVCLAPFDIAWTPCLITLFLFMHWGYAALALGCLLVLSGLNLLGDAVSRRRLLAANDDAAAGLRHIAAALTGAEAVLAMGMLPALRRRWQAQNHASLDGALRALLRSRAVASAARAARQGMTAAMVSLGLILVLNGLASPGSMVGGNMILARLLQPFESIANTRRAWINAWAAWRRVEAVLRDTVPTRYAHPLPVPAGRVVVDRLAHIPAGADRPVLRGVSFDLQPGEVLGIIGPAAAGKSTLLRLILGLEQPTAGGVFLDGHSTALWRRDDFARHVGYVPQAVQLTEGSVAENIARLQRPNHAAVLAAARQVGLHETIAALPHGYATRLDASGFTLSAGQRQRLTLARALYGDPRLLVLDEPNAFLDMEGESLLIGLLRRLSAAGVTVILVTHRPALIAAADRLLVLKDGLIDRLGTREAVLRALAAPRVRLLRASDRELAPEAALS